jgi:hypothetical protein
MTQVLKHLKNSTIADGPDPTQINPSDWNAAHVFSAGALGSLLMRDTGDATYGASWLASVAAGQVLISNGVGAAPAWAASLTLAGNLTVGGTVSSTGQGGHTLVYTGPGFNTLLVQNAAAGTGNAARLMLGNDASASQFQLTLYSTTFTAGAPNYADGVTFLSQGAGGMTFYNGNATARLEFWTAGTKRWTIDSGGNFVMGTVATGSTHLQLAGPFGQIQIGNTGTAASNVSSFVNANGIVGTIVTSGSGTAYNQTSDGRLKTDRGLARSTAVLERTEIHEYVWNVDGTPGRGVFSQDAHAIAPYANTPGTDERDADGRLVHPWATDYSKYVPDLIVGWQQHNARLKAIEAAIAKG